MRQPARSRLLCLAAGFGILSASGGTVYTSLATWQASTPGNSSVLDFESAAVSYYSTYVSSLYTFTPSNGGLYILNGASSGTGSGHYLTTDLASSLTITFGSGVYGVAFNLGSNTSSAAAASILATDIHGVQYLTSGFNTSGTNGTASYWGLRNDIQLASVKITFTGGVQPQLDNVRYASVASSGNQSSTPEPSTWILFMASGVLLRIAGRAIKPISRAG